MLLITMLFEPLLKQGLTEQEAHVFWLGYMDSWELPGFICFCLQGYRHMQPYLTFILQVLGI